MKSFQKTTRTVADDAEQRAAAAAAATAASHGIITQTGTVTLVSGVSPAIPAPSVVSGLGASKILFTLAAVNASTALGIPFVSTLTPGVSFVVTAATVGTPGATQTGDDSTYNYVIVNPS